MPVKKDVVVARLTVRGLGRMTLAERRLIAQQLKDWAKSISNKNEQFSNLVTFKKFA